mgnify:CR=1 FL=1
MLALRTLRAAARPLVRAPVARTFTALAPRFSDHQEPQIFGAGGKPGEVPTDLDQATGIERFELLYKLKGEEAFSTQPLEVLQMGTLTAPVEVFSLVSLTILVTVLGSRRVEARTRALTAPAGQHAHHRLHGLPRRLARHDPLYNQQGEADPLPRVRLWSVPARSLQPPSCVFLTLALRSRSVQGRLPGPARPRLARPRTPLDGD